MTDDFISSISQKKHTESSTENIFFPEIPDPPPGFDPEANILYETSVKHSDKAKKPKKRKLVPRAKVFIIGSEGNSEYEEILLKGIEGEVVLGRKEISDLRGSDKYKVFLEWMEVVAKK
tara:strand:+ start:142 stop:498 length:357 start_codon:yes stop_codon:yes gene_type:complete